MRIEWTGSDGSVRHGEVWSPGPVEGSAWIIPDQPRDGEGCAVCVGLDGRQTSLQAQWSQREYQDDVHLHLPEAALLPAPTARGGQLRVSLTPMLSRKDTP